MVQFTVLISVFTSLSSYPVTWASGPNVSAGALGGPASQITSLLKPVILRRILEDREVMTHASLDSMEKPADPEPGVVGIDPGLKRYSFYASMLVREEMERTRQILTDYQLYAKMVPYVDRADYSKLTHILEIEGGIWKFRLTSSILFEEVNNQRIHYQIVGGHFKGLSGDIFFESRAEQGTLVYMSGSLTGLEWPPRFVIERGAEVVFGFTAKKMRSYIETQKQETKSKITSSP